MSELSSSPIDTTFVVAFVVGVTPGKWAGVWAERLPTHPLELRPLSPVDAVAALHSGEVDAAFLRLPIAQSEQPQAEQPQPAQPQLSSITLYSEQPVVVVPKDHAIEALDSVTLADLSAENLVEDVLSPGDWSAAVELVAANVGVAVMPQSVARALSRKDVVAKPVTDAPITEIALVWPADTTTELVEEFIGIVRGRSANSSRGTPTPPTEKPKPAKKPVQAKSPKSAHAKPKPRQQRFKRR